MKTERCKSMPQFNQSSKTSIKIASEHNTTTLILLLAGPNLYLKNRHIRNSSACSAFGEYSGRVESIAALKVGLVKKTAAQRGFHQRCIKISKTVLIGEPM